MSIIKQNYSLRNYNTFGITAKTKYFTSFTSEEELIKLLENDICKLEKMLILGGGSNILLSEDFDGITLLNDVKGINIIKENSKEVIIEVGAGEIWHDFVLWSVKKGFSGIENLALIPGSVGASPMQNIGAYGVEVKDFITQVYYIDIAKKKKKELNNNECGFEYRNSIFKGRLKGKGIVTKVIFKLYKTPINNTDYGDIKEELKKLKKNASPINITEAVINIRNRKLPDPAILGNCGSFFKNPIIKNSKFKKLKKEFPNVIGYKISNTKTKVSAGWLIDNAGLKGYREKNVGIHNKQALVLVNHGNAKGKDILKLAEKIELIIKKKYDISLEKEVNII
tara:strand:- start:5470 stop:6486 length:1017 start_codon:yes stop_codon:yes gene_type:complete